MAGHDEQCLETSAQAKINVFLEITGKRPDGYHNLESVFVEVDFADSLRLQAIPEKRVVIRCDDPGVPTDATNLIAKAAAAMADRYGMRSGLEFDLRKNIPSGGGMGGGSADAAAALRLIDELWGIGANQEELAALGVRVGSDVPFFLHGGVCLCRGRGEEVSPIPVAPGAFPPLGLAVSGIFSSTAAAYRRITLPEPGTARTAAAFLAALAVGDWEGMEREAFNRFDESVLQALPELGRLRGDLQRIVSRPVRLSGSGSALWFFLRPGEQWRGEELRRFAAERKIRIFETRARWHNRER